MLTRRLSGQNLALKLKAWLWVLVFQPSAAGMLRRSLQGPIPQEGIWAWPKTESLDGLSHVFTA